MLKYGEKVVKLEYILESNDINAKGKFLGYDENKVCDWIIEEGIYGQDGAGYSCISRNYEKENYKNKEMYLIVQAIFEEVPQTINEIKVLDDY